MIDREIAAVDRHQRASLQLPTVAEPAVAAEVPDTASVLAPVLGVVAEIKRQVPAASLHFEQRDGEVEIPGAHIDVLAPAAPVAPGGPHSDLPGVDGSGRGSDHYERDRGGVPVKIDSLNRIGVSGSRSD